MIYPRQVSLRARIPTVRVRLATDDGELSLRARWRDRPIDLQRRILYLLRQGQPIWLEDEWGHAGCLRAECVWAAAVDGRPDPQWTWAPSSPDQLPAAPAAASSVEKTTGI